VEEHKFKRETEGENIYPYSGVNWKRSGSRAGAASCVQGKVVEVRRVFKGKLELHS